MKKGRNLVTIIEFNGVAKNGADLIFKGTVYNPKGEMKKEETDFRVTYFQNAVMEIAIDCKKQIPEVARLIFGMFSKGSKFADLETIIVRYNNIRLSLKKAHGERDIICMIKKAMSQIGNEVTVDTCYGNDVLLRMDPNMEYEFFSKCFYFVGICEKNLCFATFIKEITVINITSLKEGAITIKCMIADEILGLKKVFHSYSNLYGIKKLRMKINESVFDIEEKNIEELKEVCEIQEIRFHKQEKFAILDDKREQWNNFEVSNCSDVVNYTILCAQKMEWLMDRYNQKLEDVWKNTFSYFADVFDIDPYRYKLVVNILYSVWEYGTKLKKLME